jgi:hypothetical protein
MLSLARRKGVGQALPLLSPQLAAQTPVQLTAEEVEALLAIEELVPPRLVRVQLETEAPQDLPDALLARSHSLAVRHITTKSSQ